MKGPAVHPLPVFADPARLVHLHSQIEQLKQLLNPSQMELFHSITLQLQNSGLGALLKPEGLAPSAHIFPTEVAGQNDRRAPGNPFIRRWGERWRQFPPGEVWRLEVPVHEAVAHTSAFRWGSW